jgi:Penicillin-insensitive murein endopeptidase
VRLLATTLAALAVLAALTAALASAVRSSRGAGPAPAPVVARLVAPAAGAFAPGPTGPTGASAAVHGSAPAPALVAPPATPAARAPVVPAPADVVPSRAVGRPNHGRLEHGVLLPPETADIVSWDPLDHVVPDRDWRRVGTDRLVAQIQAVAAAFRHAHPGAPRVVVSDLSLPEGGHFGAEYGGLGHASHQNGLDADIAYPRRDRREVGIDRVSDIDRPLAQALVDAWVAAGAQFVFVGPHTGLRGPRAIVQPLVNHDDHLHVRIPAVG